MENIKIELPCSKCVHENVCFVRGKEEQIKVSDLHEFFEMKITCK